MKNLHENVKLTGEIRNLDVLRLDELYALCWIANKLSELGKNTELILKGHFLSIDTEYFVVQINVSDGLVRCHVLGKPEIYFNFREHKENLIDFIVGIDLHGFELPSYLFDSQGKKLYY